MNTQDLRVETLGRERNLIELCINSNKIRVAKRKLKRYKESMHRNVMKSYLEPTIFLVSFDYC